ncbi:ABC transporter substrate-binding protein [Planctomonas psychrotolerans]|uniref:ABC transporter substrate-binding protein n=1 Tax=Planctomonas psychrotolerans TaxID=2528712 RepID=UPI001239F31A|nr:extracellular solute-binding protein [Planctomonas psychrotolerans]
MRKRQQTLLAITMTASVAVLAGCAGGGAETNEATFSDEPTGTLNAWGFDNADEVGTSRLDYAEEQLSDVTVEIDATGFDAQKFTTRAASGQVPDVVQMDRQFVATYAAQDLIQPLDDCFSGNDVDPAERYYQSVVDDVTYDGNIWAVPQFYQPPAIMLNKRVMDAAGVTADQIDTSQPEVLLEAATKMYQESGGNPAILGFDPVAVNQAGLWLLGYGGQLMDDEGVPALDTPENAQAIAYLKELMDAQGGYAKVKSFVDSFDVFGDANPYTADQVAAQVNPQWYVNVLTPYVEEVQIEAVPFRNQDGEPFTVASGTSFVIPVGAANPAAACDWMLALTSQEAWMAAGEARAETIASTPGAINTGLFTGSPEADQAIREEFVTESGNAGFDQTIGTYYDVVSEGVSFGASPAGQEIQSELKNAVTSALLGDKTPEEALTDAQEASMRAYDQAVG